MSKRDDKLAAMLASNDHNEMLAHLIAVVAALEARVAALESDAAPKQKKRG